MSNPMTSAQILTVIQGVRMPTSLRDDIKTLEDHVQNKRWGSAKPIAVNLLDELERSKPAREKVNAALDTREKLLSDFKAAGVDAPSVRTMLRLMESGDYQLATECAESVLTRCETFVASRNTGNGNAKQAKRAEQAARAAQMHASVAAHIARMQKQAQTAQAAAA